MQEKGFETLFSAKKEFREGVVRRHFHQGYDLLRGVSTVFNRILCNRALKKWEIEKKRETEERARREGGGGA